MRGGVLPLRLGLWPFRRALAALGHELVELGPVLGKAQALEKRDEVALLLFEPPQGFLAIFVERAVAARGAAGRGAAPALRRFRVALAGRLWDLVQCRGDV